MRERIWGIWTNKRRICALCRWYHWIPESRCFEEPMKEIRIPGRNLSEWVVTDMRTQEAPAKTCTKIYGFETENWRKLCRKIYGFGPILGDFEAPQADLCPRFTDLRPNVAPSAWCYNACVDGLVVYCLGPRALQGASYGKKELTPTAATLWNLFTAPKVKISIEKLAPALNLHSRFGYLVVSKGKIRL